MIDCSLFTLLLGLLLQVLASVVGERRSVINFKRLTLTDFKVDIKRHCAEKELKAALAENSE
jgi:large subunit ribosomal protein L14e